MDLLRQSAGTVSPLEVQWIGEQASTHFTWTMLFPRSLVPPLGRSLTNMAYSSTFSFSIGLRRLAIGSPSLYTNIIQKWLR